MMDLCNKIVTDDELLSMGISELEAEILDVVKMLKMIPDIHDSEKIIFSFIKTKSKRLTFAFKQLKNIVRYAQQFGINPKNIHLDPLLINRKQNSGFMFKIVLKDQTVLAAGGRFDSLIKMFRKINNSKISAVDISFNVENILKMLKSHDKPTPVVDVVICAKEKAAAIPIFTKLLSREIKCEIVPSQNFDMSYLHPLVVIELEGDIARIKVGMGSKNTWSLSTVDKRKWKQSDFPDYIVDVVSKFKF